MNASFLATFVIALAMLSAPLVLAIRHDLRHWRSPWSTMVAVITGIFGATVGWLAWDMFHPGADPTGHNLWPFEIVIINIVAWVALGVVHLMRALVSKLTHQDGPPN